MDNRRRRIVYLNDTEWQAILARAAREHRSASDLVRTLVLAEPAPDRVRFGRPARAPKGVR